MSQQNVEMAQRFAQHWNATGEPPWAEIDPDAVFVIDPGSFVAGTYRGHEGLRDLLRLTAEPRVSGARRTGRGVYGSYFDRQEAFAAVGLGARE